MAEVNTPVLDTLVNMNEGVAERSGLDDETFMLVRIAALASTGAPPASYLVNLGVASDLGVERRAGSRRPDRHRSGGRKRPRGERRQLHCPGPRTRHRGRRRVEIARASDPCSGERHRAHG